MVPGNISESSQPENCSSWRCLRTLLQLVKWKWLKFWKDKFIFSPACPSKISYHITVIFFNKHARKMTVAQFTSPHHRSSQVVSLYLDIPCCEWSQAIFVGRFFQKLPLWDVSPVHWVASGYTPEMHSARSRDFLSWELILKSLHRQHVWLLLTYSLHAFLWPVFKRGGNGNKRDNLPLWAFP